MDVRTIRRWDGDCGTMFEITVTEDGDVASSQNYKHAGAVQTLREEFGVQDPEAVVYNAAQSSSVYEF